jgi:hypothetical protein
MADDHWPSGCAPADVVRECQQEAEDFVTLGRLTIEERTAESFLVFQGQLQRLFCHEDALEMRGFVAQLSDDDLIVLWDFVCIGMAVSMQRFVERKGLDE